MHVKAIAIGDELHTNVEVKILYPTALDENGFPTQFETRWNSLVPNDVDKLRNALKKTIDLYTERVFIKNKLSAINESLDDLTSEKQYLEGIFDAAGIDPNAVRKAAVAVILGTKTIDEVITELSIPDSLLEKFKRAITIAKIFDWKERIWDKEAELESQVDEVQVETAEELLELYKDIPALCEDAYAQIPLEVSGD